MVIETTMEMENMEKIETALTGTSQQMADVLRTLGAKISGTKAERKARLSEIEMKLKEAMRPEDKDSDATPQEDDNSETHAADEFAAAVELLNTTEPQPARHFTLDGQLVRISRASRQDSEAAIRRIAADQAWTPEDMGYDQDAQDRFGLSLRPRFPQISREGQPPVRWHFSCAKIELTSLTEEAKAALRQIQEPTGTTLGDMLTSELSTLDDESARILANIHAPTDHTDIPTEGLISIRQIDRLLEWICRCYDHRGCTTVAPSTKAPADHLVWSGNSVAKMVVGAYVHKKDVQATDKFIIYHITQSGTPGAFSAVGDYTNFIVPSYRGALKKEATAEQVQDLIARVNLGIGLGLMPFAIRKDAVKAAGSRLLTAGTTDENYIEVPRDIKRPLVEQQKQAITHYNSKPKPSRKDDHRQRAYKTDLIAHSRAWKRLMSKIDAKKGWFIMLEPNEMHDLKHSVAVKRVLNLLGLGETASAMNIVGNIGYTNTKTSWNAIPNIFWLKGQKSVGSTNDQTALTALQTVEEDHIVWPYDWHQGLWADGKGVTPDALPMKGRLIESGFTVTPAPVPGPDGSLMPGLTLVEYDPSQMAKVRDAAAQRKRRFKRNG